MTQPPLPRPYSAIVTDIAPPCGCVTPSCHPTSFHPMPTPPHRLDEDFRAVADPRLVVVKLVRVVVVRMCKCTRRAAGMAAIDAAARGRRRRGHRGRRGGRRAAPDRRRRRAFKAVALCGVERREAVRPEEATESPPCFAAPAGGPGGGACPEPFLHCSFCRLALLSCHFKGRPGAVIRWMRQSSVGMRI
jgi:hypothetical protein